MAGLPFFSSCVGWPRDELRVLRYLVDNGDEITRETFRRQVRPPVERPAWDHPGLPQKGDWGVSYYRLPGLPIYWYVHSLIEYVYADRASIAELAAALCPDCATRWDLKRDTSCPNCGLDVEDLSAAAELMSRL